MTDLKMFSKPVVFTDFDGVLNAFPDDKLLRRGGVNKVMTWAKPDSPYAKMYNPEKAFHLDGNEKAVIHDNNFENWIFEGKHRVNIIDNSLFFVVGRGNDRNTRCIGRFFDNFPYITFHIVVFSPFQRNEREESEYDKRYRQHTRIKEYEIIEEGK